jgi:hypothetical protein
MRRLVLILVIAALFGSGCSDSKSSGYIEQQPHTNTGTGGIGNGPTGSGGGEPADVNPSGR